MSLLKFEEIIGPDDQKLEVKFEELDGGDVFTIDELKFTKSSLQYEKRVIDFGISDDKLTTIYLRWNDIVFQDLYSMEKKSKIMIGNLPEGEYFYFDCCVRCFDEANYLYCIKSKDCKRIEKSVLEHKKVKIVNCISCYSIIGIDGRNEENLIISKYDEEVYHLIRNGEKSFKYGCLNYDKSKYYEYYK